MDWWDNFTKSWGLIAKYAWYDRELRFDEFGIYQPDWRRAVIEVNKSSDDCWPYDAWCHHIHLWWTSWCFLWPVIGMSMLIGRK